MLCHIDNAKTCVDPDEAAHSEFTVFANSAILFLARSDTSFQNFTQMITILEFVLSNVYHV